MLLLLVEVLPLLSVKSPEGASALSGGGKIPTESSLQQILLFCIMI